ncbi:hypothetical protein ACJJTC_018850 [Scirpophaga incertulas]
MARMFLLKSLLEEAHALDNQEMRRQASQIRILSLLTRDDDYVRVYRLSLIVLYVLHYRFYRKFGIPGVIGCIDGTLVALKKPAEHEERFYCRKGYHARNVQLITDADLNILHVDSTYGGATHDSFIFNHCVIKDHLEALTNAGEEVTLLGDSGYAQRAYLMTPISGAEDNSPEAQYNDLHSNVVGKIVIACCVLHNLCNRAGIPAYTITEDERQEEAQMIADVQRRQARDLPTNTDLAVGQLSRQNLVNRLWRSRRT